MLSVEVHSCLRWRDQITQSPCTGWSYVAIGVGGGALGCPASEAAVGVNMYSLRKPWWMYWGDFEGCILQIFLNQWKITTQNSNKREKLKLRSSLCLRLGSLRNGGKWFLFSVDRVNVKLFWNSSPWITDGVAQLLSNEISKRLR